MGRVDANIMDGSLFASVTLGDFMTAIKNWIRIVSIMMPIGFLVTEFEVWSGQFRRARRNQKIK